MSTLLALIETQTAAANAPALNQWHADLEAEGWSVQTAVLPASATVAQVAAAIAQHAPADHVQLFGPIAVPQCIMNPDNHGWRAGDSDAPYATASLAGWNWNGTAFACDHWPSPPVRSVSRIDVELIGDAAAFDRILARNHAYRTGAFAYEPKAVIVNRLEYMQPGMRAAQKSDLEAIVGVGNVEDVTSAYPDDAFFSTYTGREWLAGCLYSGGYIDQNRMYYIGTMAEFESGSVQIGVLQLFASFEWEFVHRPLLRAALVGGSLAAIYNPWAIMGLASWGGSKTLGDVARGYQTGTFVYTWQGDATLRRVEVDMTGYVTENEFSTAMAGLSNRIAAIEAQLGSNPLPPPPPNLIVNGSFETPVLLINTFKYHDTLGPVPGCDFQAVLINGSTAWTNPPATDGKQLVAIQHIQYIAWTFTGLVPGQTYTLTLRAGQRLTFMQAGLQVLNILLDGASVGHVAPTVQMLQAFTVQFQAIAATHVLTLQGTAPGDSSVFIDDVRLT